MNMYHDADRALLDPMETASVDALRQHQLERLRWSLKHAYDNVPLYRQRFAECGAHPDDLKCLKDLAKFPFTGKNDLRDNYPYGMFAVPQQEVVRLHASSGTTGKPTVVGYRTTSTPGPMLALDPCRGWAQGDKVHVSYGYGLFTGGLGAHYGAERLGCTVIPMSGGQTEKQVQLIRDFQPDIIMVTPSYMLNLADEIERQGIDPQDLSCAWAYSAPSRGPTSCAARSSNGWASMPSTFMACRKSWGLVWRWSASKPRMARPSGRTISPRDHRPGHRCGATGRPTGRTGVHLAEQGSVAHGALPHPRPHSPAARYRQANAADWQDHRPQR